MITLTIDGIEVTVERGTSILNAARKAGVRIPALCHDERLIPFGACRLCVVELKGRPGRLMPACFNPAREGMEVLTNTPAVREARKLQLQLLLRHHPLDCPVCEAGGACELQNLVHEYEVEGLPFPREAPSFQVETRSPFIKRDMNRCVICGRCVRICDEVQGVKEISFVNRGIHTEISPDFGRPLDCEFCGQCVSTCPVGALVNKPLGPIARSWEMDSTITTCAFCGLGCAFVVNTKGKRIVEISSRYELGTNEGNLCVKGRYGWTYLRSPQRLKAPLVRKGQDLVEVSWEEALRLVADTLADPSKTEDGRAVAVLGSPRLTNEEAYVLQRFARGVLGTPHLDHSAGLLYRPLTDVLAPMLGYPSSTNEMRQIREADVILAVGADFKHTHPVAKNQVILASGRKKAKVIVLDHVYTSLCDIMWGKCLIVRPGTEGAVLRGMIKCIIEEDLLDKQFVEAHTEGLDAIREELEGLQIQDLAEVAGITEEDIRDAARSFAEASKACLLMSLDIMKPDDATDLARAAATLCLLTGKVGKRGCGLHIYSDKANSQGAIDMGLVPWGLPGFRSLEEEGDRSVFEELWGGSLPSARGMDARAILEACSEGKIKTLYVVGENPVITYPDGKWVSSCLENVDFLVVQDMFLTETAKLANVVLPVAGFVEKQGTFTSVDRRIHALHPALPRWNGVKSDLEILLEISRLMGRPMPYEGPQDVLEEISRAVPQYEGIRWEAIGPSGVAWPTSGGGEEVRGTDTLYEEGFPNGKAKLMLGQWHPPNVPPQRDEFPFLLNPQTIWMHSGSFSTWSPSLMEVCPEPLVTMHREDARQLGLRDGDRVRVTTQKGSIEGQLKTRPRGPRGIVQVPHHFPQQPVGWLLGWEERLTRARIEKA
jgi:formate dehydrogenase alpha subunit